MDEHNGSMSSWNYLDFELEIRGGGPREYPIAVRSPAGEAQAEIRFPFDEWELKDRLQALEIALLRSGGSRRRIPSPEEHTVQDFGRSLFESLLVGDVRTRYEMSLSEARRQGKGLRLKLRIQPSELAVSPWEFLYDAQRDRYPSLSSNTPLVRYLDLPQPAEPLRISPPLRVLGMVTSPLGLEPLNIEHEKRLVEEATRGLREGGLLELTWLEGQTWRHLQRAMRRGPWHVLHFVGHGGFDAATEEGALALSDDAGHMHLLRARGLAELLDDHYPLRLVFLNSCEGASGSESSAFSSTAATLVRRGVPAVVAMQYEITDRAAIEFARDFYEAVADGLPVDAAVTEARAAVSMDSMLEWGTPVLYMHSPDGHIFDISTPALRAQPIPETEDRQEEDPLRRYREAVELAWADGKLQADEVQRLGDLANGELSLGAAADIEREVMGDTIGKIIERQEEAARQEQRRRRREESYNESRRLHRDRKWQAVIDLFEQINAIDPNYPDPEGLLTSSRDALKLEQKVATPYDRGQRHMKAGEWQQALECFEEVQRLEPNYREAETLLTQTHQQVSADHAKEVEATEGQRQQRSGHYSNQAERVQSECSADTQPQPPGPTLGRTWWALAWGGLAMGILGLFVSLTFSSSSDTGQEATEVFIRLLTGFLIITIGVFTIIASSTASPRLLLRIQGAISSVAGVVVSLSGAWGDWPWVIYYYTFDLWALCLGLIQIIAAVRIGWDFKVMPLVLVSGTLLLVYGTYGTYITSVCIQGGYSGSGACESPALWLSGILLLASGASLVACAFKLGHRENWRRRERG
jgi:tetratricopeptide (TPR) repeat protein